MYYQDVFQVRVNEITNAPDTSYFCINYSKLEEFDLGVKIKCFTVFCNI